MPAIVTSPVAFAASAQVPLRVIKTAWPVVEPVVVPLHVPVKPVVNVTVGVAGMRKPVANVAVMVPPDARAPEPVGELEVLKASVHVAVAPATADEPVKVTEDGELADATPTPMIGATTAPNTSAGRTTRSTLAKPREWRGFSPAERSSGTRPSGADIATRPRSRGFPRREEVSLSPNVIARSGDLNQIHLQMPKASESPYPDDHAIVLNMGLGFATSSPTKLQATKVVRRINACPC